MLSGFKGVKYGLSVPNKETKPLPKTKLAAFADDDSDDDQQKVAKDIARQAQRKQTDRKVAKMQEAALAEDPSIFDYDSHYDEIQEQREGPKAAERKQRKSRYIEGLLDKAKERQREQDIVYERRVIKEREAEDHLFGDKERFVTAAYKAKLEEDKKWLEEEKLRDQLEAEQDVRKRGHMGDFYRNLLTNNVAFGTSRKEKEKAPAASGGAPSSTAGGTAGAIPAFQSKEWEELQQAREAYEQQLGGQSAATEIGSREEAAAQGDRSGSGGSAPSEPASAPEGQLKGAEKREETAAEVQEEAPKVSREDKAAAARERFLARKRKVPG